MEMLSATWHLTWALHFRSSSQPVHLGTQWMNHHVPGFLTHVEDLEEDPGSWLCMDPALAVWPFGD